jgi:putative transposase
MKPEHFKQLMAENCVTCSIGCFGNVWGNTAMESFYSTLKTEQTAPKGYRPRNQAHADIFDFIERFRNAKRRHLTIGYINPIEFERSAEVSLATVRETGSSSVFSKLNSNENTEFLNALSKY